MCLNILLILFHVNIVLKRGFDSMFRGVCVLLFTVTLSHFFHVNIFLLRKASILIIVVEPPMEDSQFGLLLIYLQEIKAFLSLLGNMPERMHDWNQRCLSLATFGALDIILLAKPSSHNYVLLHNHSWGNGGTIYTKHPNHSWKNASWRPFFLVEELRENSQSDRLFFYLVLLVPEPRVYFFKN